MQKKEMRRAQALEKGTPKKARRDGRQLGMAVLDDRMCICYATHIRGPRTLTTAAARLFAINL